MLDLNKRYADELKTVSGKVEAVSIRTRALKIKGDWYRISDRTIGARNIDLIKAGLNVELTYKVFRKPGVTINYAQSIEVMPEPEYKPVKPFIYEEAVEELFGGWR